MHRLQDKVAIVTGASSGIGRAAARLFAAEGARVVVGARREAELAVLAGEIEAAGGRAAALAGDVADEGYAEALARLATERFGGVDVGFLNAGTLGPRGPLGETSTEAFEGALRVNLTSAFLGARALAPALKARGGGGLVLTSTFIGVTAAMPNMAAYAASKAGLVGLVKALAVELAPAGIRVNALLPGGTDTPMGRTVAPTADARAFVAGLHALNRIAMPEEIARVALFLASEDASFVTGAAVLADGGVSIVRG